MRHAVRAEVNERCAHGVASTKGLSDSDVYALAYCLDGKGKEATSFSLYRYLAHRIGTDQSGAGFDRPDFARIWLNVAKTNEREGNLSDAQTNIQTAKSASLGTRYQSELIATSDSINARLAQREQQAAPQLAAESATQDSSTSNYDSSADSSNDTSTDSSSYDSSADSSNDTSTDSSSYSNETSSAGTPSEFDGESAATAHCPDDKVVWLNTNTGIYHYEGERWYGNTRSGAYVCEQEAIAAGDRATENGQ